MKITRLTVRRDVKILGLLLPLCAAQPVQSQNTALALTAFAPTALAPEKELKISPAVKARVKRLPLRFSNKTAGPGRTSTSTRAGGFKPKTLPLHGNMRKVKSVDEFIDKMPDWAAVNKIDKDATKTDKLKAADEKNGGRNYKVTKTHYSITETPIEIVSFAPVNGFYLGGIVQGKGLAEGLGSIQEVSVPKAKRAPLVISTNLPTIDNFRTVNNPSATTVSSALGDLMAKNNKTQWGSSVTFNIADNYNEEQTAMKLGIDAKYMAAEIHAAFASDRFGSKHSVAAAFVEKAFTAQADFEGRSRRGAFFNASFTLPDAFDLLDKQEIASNNLPAYIKSITYGRVVIFNLTSTLSTEAMHVAIGAAYKGAVTQVSGKVGFDKNAENSTFDLTVTAIGGPQGSFKELVSGAKIEDVMAIMSQYISKPAPLTTMVPISYTANTLREDKLAAMSKTTEYTVTKYTLDPIGERYTLKMWVDVTSVKDGVADNNYEVYGDMRVNGDTWWKIASNEAKNNQRGRGETINISEDSTHIVGGRKFVFDYYYETKSPFTLEMSLFDWDKASGNDRWLNIKQVLDLRKWAGKEYIQPVGDGRIHIRVERADYL